MKVSFLGLLLMLAMIAASRLSAQTSLLDLTFEQIERQLLEQPPQAIVAMSQKFAVNDVPAPIVASYSYADLDSGKGYEFNFLVAFYHIVTYDATKLNRSEEHTSELQSPDHLVSRLLLEKKTTPQPPPLPQPDAPTRPRPASL